MLSADAALAPLLPPSAVAPPGQVVAPVAPSKGVVVVTAVLLLGAMFGASALHGQWAYGDWTCALKNCVAIAPVRRRRKR